MEKERLPTKSAIAHFWASDEMQIERERCGLLYDIGEPVCWACGNFWDGRYDRNAPSTSWNKCKPLQRCHIVPESIGGSPDKSNLFLLCKDCHKASPDTISKDAFYLWVKNREHYLSTALRNMSELVKMYGLSDDDLDYCINDGEFGEYYHNSTSSHLGVSLNYSTFFACVYSYVTKKSTRQLSLQLKSPRPAVDGG